MATKKKADLRWVHRIAGIAVTFEAEDQGRTLDLEYTIIVGSLPREEGQEPLHVVYFEGQETDRGEYWWPTDGYLTVTRDAEGNEKIGDATDEEIALFEVQAS